ncbi:hormone-sensitive lipase [Nematostella vectensis]|uniref:hormone-sensitive lipase n=1 Tax=Nematostella vectensis TaxID=45351 RepID=UPI0020772074|nr:hormone-sensitive lipase [Nematostella vectensis]
MASDPGNQTVCVCPPGEREDFDSFPVLLLHLKRIVADNAEYFSKYAHKAVYKRFHESFKQILDSIGSMEELSTYLAQRVTLFDFSPEIKGNGYRSLLRITEHGIRVVTEISYYCLTHREKFYFRTHHYCLEVEAYTSLFLRVRDLLQYSKTCMAESKLGDLFPTSIDSQVMIEAEQMDRECFYGRTLGFQYMPSLRQFLHMVCVLMASFAEGFDRHKTSPIALMTASVLHTGKYTVNPEMRAKKIIKLTEKTNMDFCQAFWGITEGYGIQHFPLLVCPALKVNRVFHIPSQPFELASPDGELISIVPPCSWSGLAPTQVRLMSYEWRDGQSRDGSKEEGSVSKLKPRAKGLILHIHGGGFVAQSSKSHEVYLRMWARDLNVPILSVDYSLAPDNPFPRALEECFFAYAWALKNPDKLGTTLEYVCVAGDSAGGNLSVALCMRAAEYGIRRPDSVLAAYAPFNVQYIPSPSRLLSLMDPLLPTGILEACLKAYAGLGKSPFEECIKTPFVPLIERKVTAPVDIHANNVKAESFLDRLRSRVRSPEESPSVESPTVANGDCGEHGSLLLANGDCEGAESFHSCQSSPSKAEIQHRHSTCGCAHGESGYGCENGQCESKGSSVPEDNEDKTEASKSNGNNNSRGDIGDDLSNEGVDIESTCSFPQRPGHLNLNINDRSDHYEVTPHASGHIGVQYRRGSDDCIVVNVVESPTGEDIVEPYLRIGTPPDEEDEDGDTLSPQNEGVTLRRGTKTPRPRSMSQVPLPIAKNPYMSPLLAPDNMLRTLPPVDLVACTLDPILDDSIEFARRLRSLGKPVELYILDDLPHGFLNFNLLAQEAKEGCDLCAACLKRTLMGKRKPDTTDRPPVY